MIRRVLIVVGLIASLGLVAWEVSKKERLLASGDTVLLELAPVDPRSLMQGDYMRLDYAIARQWPHEASWPARARSSSPPTRRCRAVSAPRPRRATRDGEHRLTYRIRKGRLQVGVDAFYFQEGLAATYQPRGTAKCGWPRTARRCWSGSGTPNAGRSATRGQ